MMEPGLATTVRLKPRSLHEPFSLGRHARIASHRPPEDRLTPTATVRPTGSATSHGSAFASPTMV